MRFQEERTANCARDEAERLRASRKPEAGIEIRLTIREEANGILDGLVSLSSQQ